MSNLCRCVLLSHAHGGSRATVFAWRSGKLNQGNMDIPVRQHTHLSVAAPLPRDVQVSFEFFPPKTPQMEETLWIRIQRLAPLEPRFVSVTYGAGGSTRDRTHRHRQRIRQETALEPAAHLTCVGASREEIDEVARRYWDGGHPPHRRTARRPAAGHEPVPARIPDGYSYAADLVAGLKRVGDFEISVAAYPETHPEAPSPQADLDNLKRKIDAGATRAITQFFFDIERYFRFLDRGAGSRHQRADRPGHPAGYQLRPGRRFAGACGASLPAGWRNSSTASTTIRRPRRLVAASLASEQVPGAACGWGQEFHFYTLNRAELAYAICHVLGVRPTRLAAARQAAVGA